MANNRHLTVHFNDGTKLSFDFPEQAQSAAAKQIKTAEFLNSRHLVIEADGSVLVIPVENIKYLTLNIAGAKGTALPKHAIVGARIR